MFMNPIMDECSSIFTACKMGDRVSSKRHRQGISEDLFRISFRDVKDTVEEQGRREAHVILMTTNAVQCD